MPTAVTLFSGGGVADIGLIDAGFEIVLAVEREPWIADVYRQNFSHRLINDAVGNFDYKCYKNVDLVFLSPPCQGDSLMRSRDLPTHPDWLVAEEAIAALLTMRPKIIVLENVPAYRRNPAYKNLKQLLQKHGYFFNERIINCVNLGIPQNRKRLISIASFKDISLILPKIQPQFNWYELVKDLLPNCPLTNFAPWQIKKYFDTWGCDLNDCSNEPFLIPRIGQQGKLKKITTNCYVPTLRALGHDRHWRQFDIWDGEYLRKFLPRCEARIMTLPDRYILPVENWQAKRIIGNGFPSLAMKNIALSVIDNFIYN